MAHHQGEERGGGKPVKVHDCLLVYAYKYGKHLYNRQFTPYSEKYVNNWFRHTDDLGRAYQTRSRKGKIIRQYLDESLGMPLSSVWSDIMQLSSRRGWFPTTDREETGYPTQKPLALLERIIEASSNRGDVVFDPFCGCATTLIAAEGLVREWIGIDISPKAVELVQHRMKKDLGILRGNIVIPRDDIPKRTDKGDELRGKALKWHFSVLYGIQRGHCNGCNVHFEDRHLEMDHITPRAFGGTNHAENFQLLCSNCNRRKGTKTQVEFKAELARDRGIDTTWL